jgi:hypothetical protein
MRLLAFILELPVLVNTGEKEMKDVMSFPEVPIIWPKIFHFFFDHFNKELQAGFPQFPHVCHSCVGFVRIPLGKAKDLPVEEFLDVVRELDLAGNLRYLLPGGG